MSHVEAQFQDFLENQYPSVEEVVLNNARVLYKRKKYFLRDVRHMVMTLGYLMIVLIYLKDQAFLRLVARLSLQYCLNNPYPFPDLLMVTQTVKDQSSKVLLVMVLSLNGAFFLLHLVFGAYAAESTDDGYLHGLLIFQFVGERPPLSRWVLIAYDVGILVLQLVFHCLQCCLDDSKVLETRVPELGSGNDIDGLDRTHLEGDGYTGNVDLVTLDIVDAMMSSLGLKGSGNYGDLVDASVLMRMQSLGDQPRETQPVTTEGRIDYTRHNLPSGGFFV